MKKINRLWWKWYYRWQYIKFIFRNGEFDYAYIFDLLYVKLSNMMHSMRMSPIETRKQHFHEMWQVRRALKYLINGQADTIASNFVDDKFKKQYGITLDDFFNNKKNNINDWEKQEKYVSDEIIPVYFQMERSLHDAYIKEFTDGICKYVRGWWW